MAFLAENHRHRLGEKWWHTLVENTWYIIGQKMASSKRLTDCYVKAGMSWSTIDDERLLPVRTALMSGRFDERWRFACNLPPI